MKNHLIAMFLSWHTFSIKFWAGVILAPILTMVFLSLHNRGLDILFVAMAIVPITLWGIAQLSRITWTFVALILHSLLYFLLWQQGVEWVLVWYAVVLGVIWFARRELKRAPEPPLPWHRLFSFRLGRRARKRLRKAKAANQQQPRPRP